MRKLLAAALAACCLAFSGCPETVSCPSGSFSCGDPAGGPSCCGDGNSCCFGFDTCCDENYPHLGHRRSDGATMCYQTLANEGVTWDLLTVCGKPVN